MTETAITGNCLCGTVQYELSGPPIINVLCHCKNCKKSTGSSFMANSIFKKTQLRIHTGQQNLRTYHDSQTDAKVTVNRSFCTTCGSSLFITNDVSPMLEGAVIVTSGTMNLEGKEWAPKQEYYCRSRGSWVPVIEGTERNNTLP
ncbi:hypothetical protein EYB26_002608 [Talaromyces marneffei]|uniref:Putative glutathione-dependent formaldehyde-activating enzyme n=1 Tax=Talaromyces marneffei PM1 TaxID=1077442 RepID=A0A093UW60_TALMA|nr:uncharacterized protein EYB26_002608 [Talaromyces marneffei]QGA14952.1 hypothetical protein EYB26_002608 [Talaromyces marneffei]